MNWESIVKIYAEMNYLSVAAVKQEIRNGWIDREMLFEAWLVYEGIIGYTHKILSALDTIDDNIL